MIPSKKKKKDDLVELATKLSVSNAGTETVSDQYLAHDVRNDEVHFWDRETQSGFEAMVCAGGDFIYAAEVTEKSIVSQEIQKDSVGLIGTNLQVIVPQLRNNVTKGEQYEYQLFILTMKPASPG